VGAFQVLITVFALVIGPLNYFFFRNRKRLHLLILTVPALALVTSGLLFGYSLASDGFAVRTRVRSVSLLDQVHGEGVSLSRISYYAGLAPADGLRFSADTAVFPLNSDSSELRRYVVDWTEQQHLSGGWLRSRTPTQLLTVSSRPMGEQLTFARDTSGVTRVTNNLGAIVQLIVVRDSDGNLHVAENIAKGARVPMRSEETATAYDAVRKLIQHQQLEAPQEIKDQASWVMFGWSRRAWGRPAAVAGWSSGLLEQTLRQFTAATAPQPFLRPRAYVAISDRPTFVELGVSDTQDDDCLYVTLGAY
jgi:hypothetical protein